MRGLQGDLQTSGFTTDTLLAPEQALTLYFARAQLREPRIETAPIERAAGRVLARAVAADRDYPATARSAMDGFAVRSHDTPGELRVAGELRIGELWAGRVAPGQAIRVPTGGSLPQGADAVVPIEDVAVLANALHVQERIAPGDCTIAAASDMRAGETVLERGVSIGAAELGVLATLGIVEVPVFRAPVFGVISSGDELVDVRETPTGAQVRDSNRYALGAKLHALGASVKQYAIASDDEKIYRELLCQAIEECDGLVLSGGSSVGTRDFTPRVVDAIGSPGAIVHGLRVKPGKPTLLAAVDGKPILGLPGNPTSALTILEMVAAPIVLQLAGATVKPVRHAAVLAESVTKRAGWTWFVPARLEGSADRCIAHPLELHSNSVSQLARADAFAILGEELEKAAAGETIVVQRWMSIF